METVALQIPIPDLATRIDAAIAAAAEKIAREKFDEDRLISLEEAVSMTPWTEAGFKRVATKANLPFIKGPHKSPACYKRSAVVAMLTDLQIWPNGKPPKAAVVRFAA